MVIRKEGGPRSLFCTRCHTWVPNTANYEMKKEGFIAHSHVCGIQGEGEITDEEWKNK